MNLLARSILAPAFTALMATLMVGCTANKSGNTLNTTNTASIIGGTEVAEGSALHKSIVGIYDQERGALCTGSLLDNNTVLTAAHCIGAKANDHLIIFAADIHAVFKTNDRNFILSKVRLATKTVVNPNWGKKHANGESWGDTAVIKFQGEVPAGFEPAKMLAPDVLAAGTKVVVAGYGVSSDVLTEINPADHPDFAEKLKTGQFFCEQSQDGKQDAKTEKCYKEEMSGEGILRTTELTAVGAYNDTEVVFDQQHGQASCEGDSGGPAYVNVNGEYHLFGVTSRGTRGCNGYVVYSDVTTVKLAEWLADAKAQASK